MRKYGCKKGISLIELVIALGLTAMVISLVFFFYFSNRRHLNTVEVKSDLQYEAKVFLDSVSKTAMESTGAAYERMNESEETLTFNLVDFDETGTRVDSNVIFTFNSEEGTVTIDSGKGTSTICSDFKVLNLNTSQPEVTGIKKIDNKVNIVMTLEKKGVEYKVNESYTFRNSHLK